MYNYNSTHINMTQPIYSNVREYFITRTHTHAHHPACIGMVEEVNDVYDVTSYLNKQTHILLLQLIINAMNVYCDSYKRGQILFRVYRYLLNACSVIYRCRLDTAFIS